MPADQTSPQPHAQPNHGPDLRPIAELKPLPPAPATSDAGPTPRRLPPALRISAAERLVSAPDRYRAARNLVETAHRHGIDLDLLWGVTRKGPRGVETVAQTCLAVPSAGRTAMLFMSTPGQDRRLGTPEAQRDQLAAVLRLAFAELPGVAGSPLTLAQTLVEPNQPLTEAACRDAGMTCVGRLSFMRLSWTPPTRPPASETEWPEGVSVERLADPMDFAPDGDGTALAAALDRTYEATMDCPELCGLRATRDVIASHMATGAFSPHRWWLVRHNGSPEGCCLLNHCPANHAVELVYLGISPRLRGRGLSRRVLEHALARVDAPDAREITCAVDTRNTPAVRLYHAMGFRSFGSRAGFVMPLATARVEVKPTRDGASVENGGSIGTPGGQENIAIAKRL